MTPAFLLSACTSDSGDTAGSSSSPTPVATPTATSSDTSEKDLAEQAQAALAAVHNGKMVEAGVERVSDGIHTEPLLAKGQTYRLNVVCAGKGSAQLQFTPSNSGDKATVPCDGSVVQQRIRADKSVRIDVNGDAGASGMIAWQIDKT